MRIIRFLKAVWCWVVGGCRISLTAHQRLQICEDCEHQKEGICLVCGCLLSMKTKMDTEKCPIDKW